MTQDNILERIQQLLETNAHWIEQTRYTLVTTGELYRKFLTLESGYNEGLSLVNTIGADTQKSYTEIMQTYESILELKDQALAQLNIHIDMISTYAKQTQENATMAQNALAEAQNVKDDVNNKAIEFYALRDKIIELKTQLESFDTLAVDIQNIANTLKALKQDMQTNITQWKESILELIDNKKNELDTHINVKKDELNSHKDTLEAEITQHKLQTLQEIELKKQAAEQKHIDFLTDFLQKQETIDKAHEQIQQAKIELAEQTQSHKQDITTHATQTQQESIDNITEHKDTLLNIMREDMTELKNSYLDEIRNDTPAEVANLKQIVEEIKASNQVLGNDFTTQTFRNSGIFSKVENVDYYYIFVQGGTGGSYSSSTGGVTSFGSLISANGGGGNPNGTGQKGAIAAGFYELSSDVQMTIPSGGVIIVSYGQHILREQQAANRELMVNPPQWFIDSTPFDMNALQTQAPNNLSKDDVTQAEKEGLIEVLGESLRDSIDTSLDTPLFLNLIALSRELHFTSDIQDNFKGADYATDKAISFNTIEGLKIKLVQDFIVPTTYFDGTFEGYLKHITFHR